ncbi:hypothetical protein DAI22_08g163850 [Oryza sativa Japonica Group]|nr:hypothetical protein DAI22_08g163850 [Oryza sativa Japonica Group]
MDRSAGRPAGLGFRAPAVHREGNSWQATERKLIY